MPLKSNMTSFLQLQLEGNSLTVPEGLPIYDMQTDIPWFFEPKMPWTDLVKRTLETNPELIEMLLAPEHPPAYPGAKAILRWETHMVSQQAADDDEQTELAMKRSLPVQHWDRAIAFAFRVDNCGLLLHRLQADVAPHEPAAPCRFSKWALMTWSTP